MAFRSVIEPEAVDMLRRLFEQHCLDNRITSKEDRDSVAGSLLRFYQDGPLDEDELRHMLDRQDNPDLKRQFAQHGGRIA